MDIDASASAGPLAGPGQAVAEAWEVWDRRGDSFWNFGFKFNTDCVLLGFEGIPLSSAYFLCVYIYIHRYIYVYMYTHTISLFLSLSLSLFPVLPNFLHASTCHHTYLRSYLPACVHT